MDRPEAPQRSGPRRSTMSRGSRCPTASYSPRRRSRAARPARSRRGTRTTGSPSAGLCTPAAACPGRSRRFAGSRRTAAARSRPAQPAATAVPSRALSRWRCRTRCSIPLPTKLARIGRRKAWRTSGNGQAAGRQDREYPETCQGAEFLKPKLCSPRRRRGLRLTLQA